MRGKGLFKRLTAVFTALLITITALPGLEFVTAVDIDPIVHVADTPTIDGWREVFVQANNSTENAGGIWVDKSVFDTSADFDGKAITLSDENNFLVSLSAIASTKSITGYSYIPTDTVLVLDISGSMFSRTTDRSVATSSKAARMIEAANEAIKSLLANNNNNRVGVILYSSSGMEFLPIDRYSVADPKTDNYLEYELETTRMYGTVYYTGIDLVTGDTLKDGNGTRVNKEQDVTGGTYIQAGIEFAGDYLTSTDTTVDGGSFQAGVTRMPIIVLMSDGAATYGTANYTNVTDGSRGGPGSGSGNAGLAFVNQLTAVYTLKRIEEHYGRSALLYTLGVGVNSSEYAMSVLNPSSPNASDDVADLWELYDGLKNNATLSVDLGGSNSEQSVSKYRPATADGFTISSADRFYVDRYFAASTASDITAAFKSIVDQIIIQSKYYPTYVSDGDHHLDGEITFKDEIGRYMEVKEIKGILLGNVLFSGEAVAKAMNEGDLGTIQQATPLGDELSRAVQKRIGVDVKTAQFLIDEAYKAGQLHYNEETGEYSNYIGWYAYADGSYAGFWNGDEKMSDRPANAKYANRSYGFLGVTGSGINASNMMYISVQVHTNIDTNFSAVIFRIPSALIPLISYEVSLEGDSYESAKNIQVTRTDANPIRLVYEVGLRSDVNELTIKDVVDENYPYVDNNGVYSFYTNRWVTDAQQHEEGHHPSEHLNTVAYYTPSEENERYYYTENNIVYSDMSGTKYTGSDHPATTGDTYYRAYYVFSNTANKNGIEVKYEEIHRDNEVTHSTLHQAEWDEENGYWYIPKGYIHRTTGSFYVGKPQNDNNSGTYDFVRQPVVGMHSGTFYATAFLGNNGLLTLEPAQGIKLSKTIEGTPVPGTNTQFTFNIESANASENESYRVIRFDAQGNETTESIQFTAGKATIDLNNGDTVYILDLNEGDKFTITEADNEDYRVMSVNGDETAADIEVTVVKHEIADADFVNTYIPKGLLVVSKTVEHTLSDEFAIDAEREYEITVSLGTGLAGDELNAVIKNADGTTKNTKVTVDADGNIKLLLVHGSNIAIEDIPAGTVYSVSEADYSADGFITAIDSPNGTIVADDNSYVNIVNTYSPDGVDLSTVIHTGTKAIDGRDWLDTDTFEFVLEKFTGTGYTKVGESINVTYSDVLDEIAGFGFDLSGEKFTDIGEYRYKIRETAGDIGGITYTDKEYEFTVTVTDETMDGKLEIASVTSQTATVTALNDSWTVETPFTNTYKARGGAEVSVTVNKVIENDDGTVNTELSREGYKFGIYDANGSLIDTLVTEANGVTTSVRTYTADAIGETHTYVIREINTGVPGVVYSQDEYEFTVTIVDNLDGTVGADIKMNVATLDDTDDIPGIQVGFVNIYKPAAIVLEGTKLLNNRDMVAGEFDFEVKEGNTVVATGKNTADGRIVFTEIDYNDVGTHNYTISEVKGDNATITYDDSTVNVTVNVTANADGSLIASLADNSPEIKFENTYNLAPTTIVLKGTKTLTGKTLTDGAFTFTVYEGEDEVAEGTNAADGTITFDEIEYTAAGTHTYTITEVNGGKTIDGITYDDSEITITVNVVDNGDGTLTASVDATSPAIKFENEYNVGKTSITLKGTKTLTGKTLTDGAFTFTVYEGEDEVSEGTNAADGTITFEAIEYTKAGTHTYTVTEVNGGQTIDGITYDDSEITVTVNVVDNGDGTLTASVDANSPAIAFQNEYNVGKTSITLKGTKTLTGKTLADNQFSFVVMEGTTKVSEGTNAADGTITFDEIEYTKAGTHTYTITEVNGGETIDGITYDADTITVTVNVVDNGDGTLTASVDANSPAIAFQNEYNVGKTSITLKGTKTLTGKTLADNQFSFVVMEGTTKVSEGTNEADGTVTFDEIEYTKAGTHTYTVTEVNGGETIDGITYDDSEITITVNVVDNGDGTLTASVDANSPAIAFQNEYNVGKTSITLEGTKTLTGKTLADNQFSFVVMEGATKVSEGTNEADGTVTFDEIEYTKAGTHTYVISEVNGGETIDGITYDDSEITITVNVVDNGDGTLTASLATNSPAIAFQNEYNVGKTSITLEGAKTLTGKTLTDGAFTFTVYEGATKVSEGTNEADGTITFDEIEYTAAGTHTYTITEVNGGETIDGITYDDSEITVTVNVVDNGDGTLTASVDANSPAIKFENEYNVGKTSITLEGTKTLTGKTLTDGTFTFTVYEGTTKVSEGTNAADGTITFEAIEYTKAGTHTYTVTEVNGGETIDGITYDDSEITVTVNVVDNGDGTLTASVDATSPAIKFENEYNVGKTSITLKGTKTLTGKTLTDGAFTFTVYEGATKVSEGTNEADGTITFEAIEYTKAGTHTYTITEVNGDETIDGITYDDSEITVTVNVVDNGDGTLTASVDATSPDIKFENEYNVGKTSITLEGTKALTGKTLTDNQFSFVVMEGATKVSEGTNEADGTITFEAIEYTKAGTHTYTITEVNGGETIDGITYDDSEITVTVNVIDNGDGTLTASVDANSPAIAFQNEYNVGKTSITLEGTKTLTGKTLTDNQFSFVVMEGATKVSEGTNAADGTITFEAIEYTKAGTHTYVISEVNGGETIDGITYDADTITVTVNVVDNGDGTLTASVSNTSPAIKFENEYNVGKTSITLKGTKTLTGKTLADNQFSFVVMEGTTKVSEGTNAADGTITFDEIEYTAAGTHTYTVTEVNGGETIDGITYDDSEITVTVNVVDNGDGTLTASVDANSPAIAFQNEYNVGKTSIILEGTKALTGKTLTDGAFTFTVYEGATKVSEGTNEADGTITFDEIEYTAAGTHTYTVTEVNGGETIDGITYDDSEITVTVNVVDNGDGTLTASVDANSPAIAFQNEYNVGKTSITLEGAKTLTGKTLTDNQFSFVVMEGTAKVAEGTNAADGTITFEAIEYTKAGTHTYVISEVNGGEIIDGITYDDSEITITVNVVDNGDGTLTASVDANSPAIAFQNEYNVGKTSITLKGTKALTGKTLTDNQFSFVVMEGTTKVSEGTNAADGTITFDEIEYTKAGTHTYVISEVNGGETIDGITYDADTITVTVNVVDNGDGTLTASVDATSPEIKFENEYNVGKTSITLKGTKTLTGKTLTDGAFTFTVYEGEDEVSEGTNAADGTITFEAIEYTKAGTHTYVISEVNGGETIDGITYDADTITVTVNVVDNGDGTLTASVDANSPAIAFQNEYNVGKTSITLEGTKTLTGKTLTGGAFTFTVYEGTTKVAEGTNAADGTITFDEIEYTAAGTHTYTITEVNGGETIDGITYDDSEITVTVNVVDNGDGILTASVDANSPAIAFVNTYAVSGEASITLNGTKILDGRAMVDGEFEFEVKEGDDVVARGTNNANGEILFETITYTAAGTHTYTVTEVKGTDKEITYDEASYTVVVNVTDNGDGTLTASFEGEAPVIEFANTYTYIDDNAYLTLKATKAYNKGTLKGDDFSFELKDESGNVLQTVTNDVQGNITFETITYTAQGTYLYTINEVIGSDSDIKYDKSVYTVTVNVTAQADGKLVADIAITVNETETEEIIFINTYDKPAPQTPIDGHIKINVKKQIVDETGDGYKLDGFVFILENLTTGQIYNATSDVNGDAVFDVGFTVAEVGNIYEYELTEADTRIEGMEYDTSAHRFNIKVTYIPPIAKVDAYIYRDGKTLTGVIATFVNTYKGIPKIDPPDEPDIDPVEPICFEEEDVIGC